MLATKKIKQRAMLAGLAVSITIGVTGCASLDSINVIQKHPVVHLARDVCSSSPNGYYIGGGPSNITKGTNSPNYVPPCSQSQIVNPTPTINTAPNSLIPSTSAPLSDLPLNPMSNGRNKRDLWIAGWTAGSLLLISAFVAIERRRDKLKKAGK